MRLSRDGARFYILLPVITVSLSDVFICPAFQFRIIMDEKVNLKTPNRLGNTSQYPQAAVICWRIWAQRQ